MLPLNQRGFSLIELLVVVVIVGIIAAVAVPNILSARRAANEGSAVSSLRNLHSAQLMYKATAGGGDFAGTNAAAGDAAGINALRDAQLIDSTLGSATKSGYTFVGAVTNIDAYATGFFFSANPVSSTGAAKSGNKRFGITHDGTLRGETTTIATAYTAVTVENAPPLGTN